MKFLQLLTLAALVFSGISQAQITIKPETTTHVFDRGNIDFELTIGGNIETDTLYIRVHKVWFSPNVLKTKYYIKDGYMYPKYLYIADFPQIAHEIEFVEAPHGTQVQPYRKITALPVTNYIEVKSICYPGENLYTSMSNEIINLQ